MKLPPFIALIITSALIIFSPLQEGGTTHPAQMVIRLLVVAWLGVFLARGIRAGRLVIPAIPAGYATLSFVGLAVVATVFSPYPHPGRQWLLMIAVYITFFYLLVSFVDRWEHIRTLAAVIVLMGLAEAGWALVQGLASNVVRPSGTFFNPNFLAGYLTVTWAILLSCVLYGYRRGSLFSSTSMPRILWWTGQVLALSGVLLALVLTQSRGGLLGFFVITVFILTIRYGWKLAATSAVVLLLILLLVPTPMRERVWVEHQQNPVAYARWQMWQGALTQMIDHPLGVGLGLYQYTYPRYAFPVEGEIARYGKVAQTAHNDYLQMGVEMGPGAILIFAFAVFIIGRELTQVLCSRLLGWQRSLIVGIGGGGVALLVHAGLDSSLRESALAILLMLCGGLIVSAGRLVRNQSEDSWPISIRPRFVWGMIASCLLLVVVFEVIRSGIAWMTFESASRQAMAGQTVAAINGLKQAIGFDPGKALYHHGLGSVYARVFESTRDKQTFQRAHEELKAAIEINPLDSRLLGLLAQLYVSAAQVPSAPPLLNDQQAVWVRAAVRVYERAINLAPFSAPHRYEQARLYWLLGERSEAERRAKEAERLEPNYLPARALLVSLWVDQGLIEDARTQLLEIETRQARYQRWSKNTLDKAFLNVDVSALRAAVGAQGGAG